MTTRVIHHRDALEFEDDVLVWIDRRSKWGNPFIPVLNGGREKAIHQYEAHIRSLPSLMAALPELDGKVLVCWCKPKACHGDVLVKLLREVTA